METAKKTTSVVGVSPGDVINITETDSIDIAQLDTITKMDNCWAVTLNINPTRKINKRQWKLYNHDQQRAILSRIEKSLRKKTPSIQLIELHFEVCPIIKNIHFHALYEFPSIMKNHVEAYYNRVVGDKNPARMPWRHLDLKSITYYEGWINYIRKDTKPPKDVSMIMPTSNIMK